MFLRVCELLMVVLSSLGVFYSVRGGTRILQHRKPGLIRRDFEWPLNVVFRPDELMDSGMKYRGYMIFGMKCFGLSLIPFMIIMIKLW
jgi:hypothetical protein